MNAIQRTPRAEELSSEPKRPLRVLHVIPSLSPARGGPTEVVRGLATAQIRLGHRVHILTTDQGRARVPDVNWDPKVGITMFRMAGPDRLAYATGTSSWLRSNVKEYDMVHSHSLFSWHTYTACRHACAAGVPYVIRPCGMLDPVSLRRSALKKWLWGALFERRALARCSAVHFTSRREAQKSVAFGSGRVPGFILPNGIALDEMRASLNLPLPDVLTGQRYFLYLGRLERKKNLELALEALSRLQTSTDDCPCFAIVGPEEGAYGERLRVLARELRLTDRVLWLGPVYGPKRWPFFRHALAFLLPSVSENFGMVAAEAAASGVPVLCAPGVDMGPDIAEAGAGLVCNPDPEEWAEALDSLGRDEAGRRRISEKARAWANTNFDWQTIAGRLDYIYNALISGNGIPAPFQVP